MTRKSLTIHERAFVAAVVMTPKIPPAKKKEILARYANLIDEPGLERQLELLFADHQIEHERIGLRV